MHLVISCAYECAYVSCMSFRYIHIYQCICVLCLLQIHAHMHWQDHWWTDDTCTVVCSFSAKTNIWHFVLHCIWGCFEPKIFWFPCLNENYGCCWQATATVALVFRPTFVSRLLLNIRSSDETSDALFKRVKPIFGVSSLCIIEHNLYGVFIHFQWH